MIFILLLEVGVLFLVVSFLVVWGKVFLYDYNNIRFK